MPTHTDNGSRACAETLEVDSMLRCRCVVPQPAPLGLEAESELWIVVNGEGDPFLVDDDRTCESFVACSRSEADLAAAMTTFNDPGYYIPPGRFAETTEASLVQSIQSVPDGSVAGFIIFDRRGMEVRVERVV